MTTTLVLGASGYVGSHLVPRLVEEGHEVRAAGRRRETLEAREWEGVEVVQADALDRESLGAAFKGVDLVYYLVHSMASGTDFPERDRRAAENASRAAEEAGRESHRLPGRAAAEASRRRRTWPPAGRRAMSCARARWR